MLQVRSLEDPAGRSALLSHLEQGGVVALPTETVPGLAVRAVHPDAAGLLAALKGAPMDRPFSLHLRHVQDLRRWIPVPPPGLAAWMSRRLPGPTTVVIPKDWAALPREWNWPWDLVGFRVPSHSGFQEWVKDLQEPLWMTSINNHGDSPYEGEKLRGWLADHPEIEVGFDPSKEQVKEASTVVAFDPLPRVLRGTVKAKELRPGLRILVLCSGNICRSPVAAALLERELAASWGVAPADLQELGWVISSAGTAALPGGPASDHSITAAQEIGLDIQTHRAQQLEEALRFPWDLVLTMGYSHLRALPPTVNAATFEPNDREIPDPFGMHLGVYRAMRDSLMAAVEERILRWSRWP